MNGDKCESEIESNCYHSLVQLLLVLEVLG